MKPIDIIYKCIVPGSNLRPKILFVDKFNEVSIALKPISGIYDKPLWFPKKIVFKFDQKLFDELSAANEEDLKKIWTRAKPWEPVDSK